MKYNDVRDLIERMGKRCYRVETPEGVKRMRLSLSAIGDVIEMISRSRKYGTHVPHATVESWESVVPYQSKTTAKQKWERGWNKVLSYLKSSGFWADVQEDIELGLKVGYDTVMKIRNLSFNERDKIKEIAPELVDKTFIEYHMTGLPRVKTMRFSNYKYTNEIQRQRLKDAIESKQHIEINDRANYDISVEFRPANHTFPEDHFAKGSLPTPYHRCWYSEEYKGCGNGHYYLGIDHIHALFYEDD